MLLFKGKPTIAQLQWLVWVFVFLVLMLSLITMDGFVQATVYAIIYTCFYAAIVYGNILFLFPRFYQEGQLLLYIVSVVVFLLVIGALRGFITMGVYNILFAKHPEAMTLKAFISITIGGVMIFLLSFVFRIAIAYFTLKQQSEDILAQKNEAELNLLKSQVQPHFLFNTLNNIYYEAYLEAPRTAALIERLSDIMRYFVDESPKQKVSINTEVQFLENYIALEKIRIRYAIDITFTNTCDTTVSLPPMLLMTFVENIFKHGIDKSSSQNKIEIKLSQLDNRLLFTTSNTIPQKVNAPSTGFGIQNLRKRLVLLYGKAFDMDIENNGTVFTASLNIPLA
ncbi:hypothetical protein FFF34_015905 [Inquilinus sp. KBS0705]|nr:hypothetical protein FFF34_015905 [Inquilinus sp. KBS0705]